MKLILNIDGKATPPIERAHYVKAKTKQLREFGYSKLTEAEVDKQVDLCLAGKKIGDKGFTVIGGFMKDDIVRVET